MTSSDDGTRRAWGLTSLLLLSAHFLERVPRKTDRRVCWMLLVRSRAVTHLLFRGVRIGNLACPRSRGPGLCCVYVRSHRREPRYSVLSLVPAGFVEHYLVYCTIVTIHTVLCTLNLAVYSVLSLRHLSVCWTLCEVCHEVTCDRPVTVSCQCVLLSRLSTTGTYYYILLLFIRGGLFCVLLSVT